RDRRSVRWLRLAADRCRHRRLPRPVAAESGAPRRAARRRFRSLRLRDRRRRERRQDGHRDLRPAPLTRRSSIRRWNPPRPVAVSPGVTTGGTDMLWNLEELRGYALRATDGSLGSVADVYFDDETW